MGKIMRIIKKKKNLVFFFKKLKNWFKRYKFPNNI